ncbi:MAG TPA: hypothetical protein VM889_14865 [Candidatus Thermoplasmatota archaeon]|nr:hypothetical protein [Candidatus Thermoplasmatota archaeon]
MPPAYVKTCRDLLCYEAAKLEAVAARRPGDARFILDRVKTLRVGPLRFDEVEDPARCLFDGIEAAPGGEWLVPLEKGGLEVASNLVPACESCRASKGNRDVLAWYKDRRVRVPRAVWRRYLRAIYDTWEKQGILEGPVPASEAKRWSTVDVER